MEGGGGYVERMQRRDGTEGRDAMDMEWRGVVGASQSVVKSDGKWRSRILKKNDLIVII